MTKELSLAQFVASLGGIRYQKGNHDRGELAQIRDANAQLKGRNSIFRPTGQPADMLQIACEEEGYPVDAGNFIDKLETDVIAWANGSDKNRIWRNVELSYNDRLEYEGYVHAAEQSSQCEVCFARVEDPEHQPFAFEHQWLNAQSVHQLRGESRAALYLSLLRFIYQGGTTCK